MKTILSFRRFRTLTLLIMIILLLIIPDYCTKFIKHKNALHKLPDLIQGLQSSDFDLFNRSALGIAEIGPSAEQAVPILVAELNRNDLVENNIVSYAIAAIGPPALPELVLALNDRDKWVRRGAAMAIAQISQNPKEIVPVLITVLNYEEDRDVKAAIIYALSKRGRDALPALLKLKEISTNPLDVSSDDAKFAIYQIEASFKRKPK